MEAEDKIDVLLCQLRAGTKEGAQRNRPPGIRAQVLWLIFSLAMHFVLGVFNPGHNFMTANRPDKVGGEPVTARRGGPLDRFG
jgi:hypothetical protein